MFTLVIGIEEAKKAWQILQTRFEETDDVKQSKLQMVLSEFEGLKMNDEETITYFHDRVQDLMNQAFVLGELFTESWVVKKVLRSLLERFQMKVTTIHKNSGWENKIVGELIGSLHTYGSSRKGKSVAFAADVDTNSETESLNNETLVPLTKNFMKILKGFGYRGQGQTKKNQRSQQSPDTASNPLGSKSG